jgi:hypothetical protein
MPTGPSSRPSPLARWARTAGAQIAGLTIVGEGDTGDAGESGVQVGVVQHDGRGLAAQLQRYRTRETTADPGDLAARGSGTGEGDLVDIGMRGLQSGLEDYRAARSERRGGLHHRQCLRMVPRRDRADDPNRLPPHQGAARGEGGAALLPLHTPREPGVVVSTAFCMVRLGRTARQSQSAD